jgi:peroxiredoxin
MAIESKYKQRGSTLSLVAMLVVLIALVVVIIKWPFGAEAEAEEVATEQVAVEEVVEAEAEAEPAEEPKSEQDDVEATTLINVGDVAPDFTVTMLDGRTIKLSELRGNVVMVCFWATWCPPCRREMPEFQKMYEELYGEVVFLMVNVTYTGETVSGVKEFLLENGYTFTVLYDTYGEASDAYGIEAYPTTYFIDKDGYLIARAVGAISLEVLKSGIDLIT